MKRKLLVFLTAAMIAAGMVVSLALPVPAQGKGGQEGNSSVLIPETLLAGSIGALVVFGLGWFKDWRWRTEDRKRERKGLLRIVYVELDANESHLRANSTQPLKEGAWYHLRRGAGI